MSDLLEDLEIPQIGWGTENVRLKSSPKRVRALAGGLVVVDSTSVKMMLEPRHLPVYYFPKQDVRMDLLRPAPASAMSARKGPVTLWTLTAGEKLVPNALFSYEDPPPGCPDLSGLIAMYWDRMDAVFEEEEEVFTHARDPHHRIEVLRSTRHVEVTAGKRTLAVSVRPVMLLESHLPPRFYLPKLDVRFSGLDPSPTVTACPYKGRATQNWSVKGGPKDVAWCYPYPTAECAAIANHVAFYQEKVEVRVDGRLSEPGMTPWS